MINKSAEIIEKYLYLHPEIWLKNEDKNNLYLVYPKLDQELHISPEFGPLARAVIPFEKNHRYYITKDDANYDVIKNVLNDGIKDDNAIYITPITCYVTKEPKFIGALVVGAKDKIDQDAQEIVDAIADNLGTAIYKQRMYSTIDDALTDYERNLALFADTLKNKLIPVTYRLKKLYKHAKQVYDYKVQFDRSNDNEKWMLMKKMMEEIDALPLETSANALDDLGDIDKFIEKVTDYSDVFINNIEINPKVVELNSLITSVIEGFDVKYYSQSTSAYTYHDPKYLEKLIKLLVKGAKEETNSVEVLLLDKEDQYRIIVKMYHFKVPVEKFNSFFRPKTIQDYRAGGNGLYFVASKYLANKMDIDLWLNSPKHENFTDVIFNLPKYEKEE